MKYSLVYLSRINKKLNTFQEDFWDEAACIQIPFDLIYMSLGRPLITEMRRELMSELESEIKTNLKTIKDENT